MNPDLVMIILALFVLGVTVLLFGLHMFEKWAGPRLDDEIDQALDLAKSGCECGDPNEVTVAHSSVRCVLKPDQQRGVSDV